MKGFRIFLCAPILTSFNVQAEVKMLNDYQLSRHSGQAGLTIDTSSIFNANEFDFIDTNMLNTLNMKVGGHGNDGTPANSFYTNRLDNLRVNLSLAGSNSSQEYNNFMYGFSEFRDLASIYLENGNTESAEAFKSLASGIDSKRGELAVDDKKRYDEDDLLIHYSYLDPWEKDGGFDAFNSGSGLSGNDFKSSSYQEAEELATRSVDFKFTIGEVGIANGSGVFGGLKNSSQSNFNTLKSNVGTGSTSTKLMSNFSMQGYLGPHDIHIKNYVNETSDNVSKNQNDAGITWNSYFKVTDMEVYYDVSGIQVSDIQIHNNRGDLSGLNLSTSDNSEGNSSFGFAHAQREIYSIPSTNPNDSDSTQPQNKEGVAFNTRFKGDIDIGHLSFGDTGTSIGRYYITDMYFNNQLIITSRE
jgi:hypothetical protein